MSVPKENKLFVRNEIPNQKFQILSDFKTKFSQGVRFQIKFFTTRQILKQNFYNMPDFVFKKDVSKIRFCTKMCFQKITFWLNLPRKLDEFCNFCALLKSTILTQKISLTSRFLLKILYNVSDFELKFLQRVRF